MAGLSLHGLRKAFGAAVAVERFDLDVADGELVALLGPSGCGKSTVLRAIAGITAPDAGEIRIGGRAVEALAPERRNVGLVFQSYALFPHLTVEANIGFGLRMRGVARRETVRRVCAALEVVALAGLERRYPRELSGGQQQRVALARALVIEPDVLLLDEPLSNLDAKLREHLRGDIKSLQRRVGITTLYVTHDQAEALALADRIVVMNAGRIVEIGSPVDLYRAPRARFTAEFLGHTNLVEAQSDAAGIVLPWGARLAGREGVRGAVTLLVRPEDLIVVPESTAAGRIEEVSFHGAEIEYRLRLGDTTLRARRSGLGAQLLAVGTPVSVRLPENAHAIGTAPGSTSPLRQVA